MYPDAARWRQWVTRSDGTKRAGINTIYDSAAVDVFSDTSGVVVCDVLWVDTTSGNTYRRVDVDSFRGRYWIPERAPYVVRGELVEQDETVTQWALF